MEKKDVPGYVLVWLRIRRMHDREQLHWLHRVRGYRKLTNNIISVGSGNKTKNFKFPVILDEDAS
jgi:hypothetical protein